MADMIIKTYMNLGETRFITARMILKMAQKILDVAHARLVEYCLRARNPIIQMTNIITGKNKPSVAVWEIYLKNSYTPEVSFPDGTV